MLRVNMILMQKDLLILHTVNIGPRVRIPVICFISVVFEKYILKIIVNKFTNVHTRAAFVINWNLDSGISHN